MLEQMGSEDSISLTVNVFFSCKQLFFFVRPREGGVGQKSRCSRNGMLRANNGRRPRPCGRRDGSRHRDETGYQTKKFWPPISNLILEN